MRNRSCNLAVFFVLQERVGAAVGNIFQGGDDSSSKLTPQQERAVNVNVIKGDILASPCEVMINTTGSEFNLTRKSWTAIKSSYSYAKYTDRPTFNAVRWQDDKCALQQSVKEPDACYEFGEVICN